MDGFWEGYCVCGSVWLREKEIGGEGTGWSDVQEGKGDGRGRNGME